MESELAAKNWRVNAVEGVLFKPPVTVVLVVSRVTALMTGKFCNMFTPVSASPKSL